MNFKNITFLALLQILVFSIHTFGQNEAIIYGTTTDEKQQPIEYASISVLGLTGGTYTDKYGKYELKVPANTNLIIKISYIGFESDSIKLKLKSGEKKLYNFKIKSKSTILSSVEIKDNKSTSEFIKVDPKIASIIPNISGGIETVIKTLPGVSSNNELSSQYSVRGGNYDENLVYVNDIEIYRPFLVHTGEQEGLSFVNSDMVSSLLFSAGGFEARYGDKMSSVLDIQYKKPIKFAGSSSLSLLGGNLNIEGCSKDTSFKYLMGIRQKSNQYILNSLQTKGDYKPSFTDFQTYLCYDISKKLEISTLGYYSRNLYKFVPTTRETTYGTFNEAYKLTIYFDGKEEDKFETYFGAVTANYKPSNKITLKLIGSSFKSFESETYDIQGQYFLNLLENNMGSDEFGNNVGIPLGVGTFLNHARNNLDATVYSLEHKGGIQKENKYFQWGIKYQHEIINDYLDEWKMIDSAGYSLPVNNDSVGYNNPNIQPYQYLNMQEVIKSKNNLSTNRYSSYIQNNWSLNYDSSKITITAGLRANYWDLNKELLISPRISVSLKPNWEKDITFRFSTGYYYQPPFYRELRGLDGKLNKEMKAQKSLHFVLGSELNFKAWDRPFKYTTEIYYKKLNNLVPYIVDNVKIRYFANNNAKGYATGIDMRISGEFVDGVDSWASLSIMQTKEDIIGDYYYDYYNKYDSLIIPGVTIDQKKTDSIKRYPGYIPRPSNQLINLSLFFQDYLPMNPTYKMSLNFIFGSGLPFGPPGYDKYKDTLKMPAYMRVDIGFAKQLKDESTKLAPKNPFRFVKSAWITAEVFNLFQRYNVISYLWIKDVSNRSYAVPNYLTSRQFNIKLIVTF
jgi:hypothetical protein